MISQLHLYTEMKGIEENISAAYGRHSQVWENPQGKSTINRKYSRPYKRQLTWQSYKSLSAVSERLLFPSPILSPGSSQIKRPERCSCHRRLFLKRLLKGGGTRVMQGPLQGMRGSGSFTLLITTSLLFWKFSLTLSPRYLQSDNKANIVHQVSI